MSLPKEGRNFRHQNGKNFPAVSFAAAVAEALHREYDHGEGGVGRVVELTGANERTVRNWFEAKNGPNGEFLIALCRHSDRVLDALLLLAGRIDHLKARKLVEAKQKLHEILALVNDLECG